MQNNHPDPIKYPIGVFERKEQYSKEEFGQFIDIIERAPGRYYDIVKHLPEYKLERTYRPGSWNVRQLIHHVADIQLVHYFRMKKALTDADYREVTLINMDGWAQMPDARTGPIADSLEMLAGITKRYVSMMRSLNDQQIAVSYFHPVRKYTLSQSQAIAMSAWHLQHHLGHINLAIQEPGA